MAISTFETLPQANIAGTKVRDKTACATYNEGKALFAESLVCISRFPIR
jgi:hypothetical protein